MEQAEKPMIELRDLSKSYPAPSGKAKVPVLKQLELTVKAGEFVAVMGESGVGKSTLMNIVGCLDVPDGGTYLLSGTEVGTLPARRLAKIRSREIGFIFQNSSLISSLTALENIELPLYYQHIPKKARRRMAEEALERVRLSERKNHLPGQLSGGQRQRAAIARAIAARPNLILADEPTGSLDARSGREVMEQMVRLHESGKTILLITHDPKTAAYADRTLYLKNGRLFEDKLWNAPPPSADG